MWKDFYRNIVVIFQSTILIIVGFYVGRSAYIFDPKPEGNFLTLFRINNRTTDSSLRRVLSTCEEVHNMTLIFKPLTSGTKWDLPNLRKKWRWREQERRLGRWWENQTFMQNLNKWRYQQAWISGHLSTRLTKCGDLNRGNATEKGRTILEI